ncbi:MAG TPA: Ig-like domain-containing protein [Longimicrobiales bacterium]|nr:Ig-like domain-containing protein [Longimicrobiales bacterium]
MNRVFTLSLLLLAAGLLSACGDTSGPRIGPPASIVRVLGDDQSGAAGQALGAPVTVRVNDAQGQGVANVVVTFAVQAGGGSVTPSQTQTNAEGQAQASWTLGLESGTEQRLQASFTPDEGSARTVQFRATATAGTPVALLKVGGDNQDGGTGSPLPDSLAVRVTDQYGNGVPGITVTWTAGAGSLSPATRTTNAQGFARTMWTLGPVAGSMQASASAGSLPAVTFLAEARPLPAIAGITPAVLVPGAEMVVTGVNFPADPAAMILRVAGAITTVTSATETEIRATLPAAGFNCVPTGNGLVQLTASGVITSRAHPVQIVEARPLAIGEALVSDDADRLDCVALPSDGMRYLLAITNTDGTVAASHGTVPQPTSAFGFRLNTVPPAQGQQTQDVASREATQAVAPRPARNAAQQDALRRAVDRRAVRQANHAAVLQASNEMVARVRLDPTPLPAQRQHDAAAASVPSEGDLLTMRVPRVESGANQMCTQYDEIQARVAYVGERAIVLADTSNPVKSGMDTYYRQLGEEFDLRQYGIVRDNFADPLVMDGQLNNDGRIFMLFTRRVDGNRIAGFVFSGDFYGRNQCEQSNVAEIFYGYVPTSSSTEYDPNLGLTIGMWWWDIRATVIHEVKHLASFASRISRDVDSEQSWLEESTAMMAEELWARQVFGYGANANVGYEESVGCEIRGAFGTAPCAGRPGIMFGHFMLLSQWMTTPDTRSPLGRVTDNDGSFYGSGWLFLRHVIENSGRAEQDFLSELTQATSRGAANLEARAGRPFADLVGEWALATALDDRPGTAPGIERQVRSWNLRSVYSGLNQEQPQLMPTPFPLGVTALSFTAGQHNVQTVRGGSTRYFELAGGSGGPLALEFLGTSGAALPPSMRIRIYRIE